MYRIISNLNIKNIINDKKFSQNLLQSFENPYCILRSLRYKELKKSSAPVKRSIFNNIFGKYNGCYTKIKRFGTVKNLDCIKVKQTPNSANIGRRLAKNGVCVTLNGIFKIHNLSERPSCYCYVTKEEAILYYRQMKTIRRMEIVADRLYKQKVIRGFCHLYTGQEACATGIKAAMSEKDQVITAYRCHGWCYLMGLTPFEILAELTGHAGGCQRGKGGSMHMYAKNFYGGNGIVGSQVSLGAGVSLFCKYQNPGSVCFALYGDGAANQGQVFESYNMAYLWKLPCIFVCENNNFGMGTSAIRSSMNTNYYERGNVIPGICVDGMDILAVRNATDFAIDYVLKHERPIIMELDTYRFGGHSMSDPGTSYRTHNEVQTVRATRDPIKAFKIVCDEYKLISPEEIKDIDEKVRIEVDQAVAKAIADAEVPLEELTSDVYVKCLEPKIRNTTGYTLSHKLTHPNAKKVLERLNASPVAQIERSRRIPFFGKKFAKKKPKQVEIRAQKIHTTFVPHDVYKW